MSTRQERAQEARDDLDPDCIGCALGICTQSHDRDRHDAGACGDDCEWCATYATIVSVEDDDTRPACPLCGSRRGVQVLGAGTVWCLRCDEPATS